MTQRLLPLRKIASGGRVVTIPEDLISVAAGLRAQGVATAESQWMGAGDPPRIAITPNPEERRFDYPVHVNTRFTPKTGEGVTFPQLRLLADAYDLLRVIIERRKDQIESFEWEIISKKGRAVNTKDIDTCTALLEHPSTDYDWGQWLRAALEDLLVCDAITIAPRYTYGNDLYALDLIDPATIKKIIDDRGMVPISPDPAYQQVIKGIPAVNFTTDELFYWTRNPRTWRIYGFSPVEWIVVTVNIALQRQAFTTSYFSEGNIPEALASVPEGWTTQQIREFQTYWDDLMLGNMANRRRLRWIPTDANKIKELKQPDHKNEFEEWLARLVCFAFSVSPSALIKDMNRATADTNREIAVAEGVVPTLNFLRRRINSIIQRTMGFADLQFEWKLEGSLDAEIQAKVHEAYIRAKVITPDEAREDLGRLPLTPEQREAAFPPAPNPFDLGMPADNAPAPEGSKKPAAPPEVEEEGEDEAKKYLRDIHVHVTVPERQVTVGDVNVTAQIPG
jgi:phage portal protein BeeE